MNFRKTKNEKKNMKEMETHIPLHSVKYVIHNIIDNIKYNDSIMKYIIK